MGRKIKTRSPIDGGGVTVRHVQFNSQREEVEFLRELVNAYRCAYHVHALARDIVFRQHQVAAKDKLRQALTIAAWVQREITYVNEGAETYQTPLHTVRLTYGDCDDFATLTASLIESLGIPAELVAMGWNPPPSGHGLPFGRAIEGAWAAVFKGKQLRHIFCRAVITGPGKQVRRVPLDATLDRPVSFQTDPIAMASSQGLQVHTVIL